MSSRSKTPSISASQPDTVTKHIQEGFELAHRRARQARREAAERAKAEKQEQEAKKQRLKQLEQSHSEELAGSDKGPRESLSELSQDNPIKSNKYDFILLKGSRGIGLEKLLEEY